MIPATFLYPWLNDVNGTPGESRADASSRALRTPWLAHAREFQYAWALVATVVVLGG